MTTRQLSVRLSVWSAASAFLLLGLCYLFPPGPRGGQAAGIRTSEPAPAVAGVLAGGGGNVSSVHENLEQSALDAYLDLELTFLEKDPQRTLIRIEDCLKKLPGSLDKDRVIHERFLATGGLFNGILALRRDYNPPDAGGENAAGQEDDYLKSLLLAEHVLIGGLQAENRKVALTSMLALHRIRAEAANEIGADWSGIPSVDALRREADRGLLSVYATGGAAQAAEPLLPWLLEKARRSGVVFLLSALCSGLLATLGEVAVRRLAARRLLLKRNPQRSAAITGRVPGAGGETDRPAIAAVA